MYLYLSIASLLFININYYLILLVTLDETPVIKEVEIVTLEEKPDPIPVIEVIADTKEKKDWPEAEAAKPEVW